MYNIELKYWFGGDFMNDISSISKKINYENCVHKFTVLPWKHESSLMYRYILLYIFEYK